MAAWPTFTKDPSATLDYTFNWAAWLASGDTLQSASATADTGLTVDSTSIVGQTVVVWVSGGEAGASYRLTCQVVTTGGRTDERTAIIEVAQR